VAQGRSDYGAAFTSQVINTRPLFVLGIESPELF
jgi:hypothetical protein